jgi:hypothetical protein
MANDYTYNTGEISAYTVYTRDVVGVEPPHDPKSLRLRANESVDVAIGGEGANVSMSIDRTEVNGTPAQRIATHGESAMVLAPSDPYGTVYVGDAEIKSDVGHVYLSGQDKRLVFDSEEMVMFGPLNTMSDVKVDGSVFTPDLNVTMQRSVDPNDLLGYSFRINEREVLELVKYDALLDKCQLVANFGMGQLRRNDPRYDYNQYGESADAPEPPGGSHSGDGTGGGFWEANGNHIYFSNQIPRRVGINTATPTAELEVVGTVKGSIVTDGVSRMENGYFVGEGVRVSKVYFENGGVFDGTASSVSGLPEMPLSAFTNDLAIKDFLNGTSEVWFDAEPSTIPLSGFRNDLERLRNVTCDSVSVDTTLSARRAIVSEEFRCDAMIRTDALLASSTIETRDLSVSNGVDTDRLSARDVTTTTASVSGQMQVGSLDVSGAVVAQGGITTNDAFSGVSASLLETLVANAVEAKLAAFDDLRVKRLGVEEHVTTGLSPDVSNAHSLGSEETRWRSVHTGPKGVTIDGVQIEAQQGGLVMHGRPVRVPGVTFPDNTTLESTEEIAQAILSGDALADFRIVDLGFDSSRSNITSFRGHYDHEGTFNPFRTNDNDSACTVYHYDDDRLIPPISSDGATIDLRTATVLRSSLRAVDVRFGLYDMTRCDFLGESVYVARSRYDENQRAIVDPNQCFTVRTIDPLSERLTAKLKADFHVHYNQIQHERGYRLSGAYVVQRGSHVFAHTLSNPTTLLYRMEIMFGHNSPRFNIVHENTTHRFYVPRTALQRMTKVYVYSVETNSYVLRDYGEYGLFPSVVHLDWYNSANHPEFYEMTSNHAAPTCEEMYARLHANGWLQELFVRIYLYLQYGSSTVEILHDSVLNNIEQHYATLVDSSSVVRVSPNHLHGEAMCDVGWRYTLSKEIFASIVRI